MSSTSPCSKSILSRISAIKLSSRWRANTTGRWPSLTNLRLVSAPITPMPPVMRTFMATSLHARADGVDEARPVLQVVVNQSLKLRGRKIDPLETVGLEEIARLRQVERLRHVGMDLVHDLGRQVG